MKVLRILLQSIIDRSAVKKIWSMVESLDELEFPIDRVDTNIYRLPLPDAVNVSIELENTDQSYFFRRSWLELLGLTHHIYIVDTRPGALFGKETILVAFRGFWLSPKIVAVAPAQIIVNEVPFPLLNQIALLPLMVHRSSLALEIQAAFLYPKVHLDDVVTEPVEVPLTGPWPEADVPLEEEADDDDNDDDPTDTPPPDIFGEEIDNNPPTYLFYGICFQGFSKVDKIGQRADPLWDQTMALTRAFQRRGYRSKTGLAGSHGPSQPPVDTFNMMMLSLERDIPLTYCNSTKDQLVIFVAAHGYGGKWNPTGQVAMKWKTVSGRTVEWITHPAFWARLQQIGAIRRHPEKLRVIVHSCRSGGLFTHRPAALANAGLFTSTSTAKVLCYASFIICLTQAMRNPRVKTWTQLFKEVKKCINKGYSGKHPQPKNG